MTPFKLSRQSIITQTDFGPHRLKTLPRGVVAADGVHHNVAAEMLGFRNGEELLTAMEIAEDKDSLIDRLTDQRMNEEFPDLLTDPKLPEEAVNALHTEKRGQLLRMQLDYIARHHMPVLKNAIKRVAARVPSEKAVREQAERTVGRRTLDEQKPHLFLRMEQKAAKEAGIALARGDFEAAFEAKRRELLNHELYRATVSAKEEMEKGFEFFKRLSKSDEKLAKSRDTDLVNAARAILAQYGIGKTDKPWTEYLEKIKAYDPEAYQTVSSLVEMATQNVMPYGEMTFEDFTELRDTIEALWSLSKSEMEMELNGRREDFNGMKADFLAVIVAATKEQAGPSRTAAETEEDRRGLLGLAAANTIVGQWARFMDGGQAGLISELLPRAISQQAVKFRAAREESLKKVLAIIKSIGKLTNKPINAPELGPALGKDGKPRGHVFKSKAELLGAILHIGNGSNKKKLLLPWGWATQDKDGNLDASQWEAFRARMEREGILTKTDYDAIQAMWDLFEETKPEAQRVHKQLFGFYFGEITAEPVQTSFGEYRGGYAPATPDPFGSFDADARGDQAALEGQSFMYPPQVAKGHTKARVENYAVPLLMDLRLVPFSLDAHLKFIHMAPVVRQTARLVFDRQVRAALTKYNPVIVASMLRPWLQRSSTQSAMQAATTPEGKTWARVYGAIRARAGMASMFANVVNSVQNLTGYFPALTRVKKGFMAEALTYCALNPKAAGEFARGKSALLRERNASQMSDMQGELEAFLLDPSVYQSAKAWSKRSVYFMQGLIQPLIDTPVWMGAYNQALAGGMEETAAIKEADDAVRHTQGSNSPEDIAAFGTGPVSHLFTQFTRYFNAMGNLTVSEVATSKKKNGISREFAAETFGIYMAIVGVPAILTALLFKGASGDDWDEDRDGSVSDDMLRMIMMTMGNGTLAMIPVAGPVLNLAINQFNDKVYDDRIATPVTGLIERATAAPRSVYKAVADDGSKGKAVKDSMALLTLLTGIPFSALGKPVGYLIDVGDGKARPTGPIDFVRGMATGRPGGKP